MRTAAPAGAVPVPCGTSRWSLSSRKIGLAADAEELDLEDENRAGWDRISSAAVAVPEARSDGEFSLLAD